MSSFRSIQRLSTRSRQFPWTGSQASAIFVPGYRILPYQRRSAHQDYGSGDGDPVGERPLEQGPNPSEHKEHPGPAAPDVGQRKVGSGPTTETAPTGEQLGATHSDHENSRSVSSGAQPRFNTQPDHERERQEDVKKHNREVDERKAKSAEQGGGNEADSVGKGFWSGKG